MKRNLSKESQAAVKRNASKESKTAFLQKIASKESVAVKRNASVEQAQQSPVSLEKQPLPPPARNANLGRTIEV